MHPENKTDYLLKCRICFIKDKSVNHNIFEDYILLGDETRITLFDALDNFITIEDVNASDYLCNDCYSNLSVTYNFLNKIENAKSVYTTENVSQTNNDTKDESWNSPTSHTFREEADDEQHFIEEYLIEEEIVFEGFEASNHIEESVEQDLIELSPCKKLCVEAPIALARPINMYECDNCIKAFSSQILLQNHVKATHKCVYCNIFFKSYHERNTHLKNQHKALKAK